MKDLRCDPASLAGPVDMRVVKKLKGLDPDFVAHMKTHHGGKPRIGAFKVGGKRYQIGLFLTLLDSHSKLMPPARPYFEDEDEDERAINSIYFLGVDGEHATSRALFGGLLPFAALAADMCLDRAYVDLLCFDVRTEQERPAVVLWDSNKAQRAYFKWDDLPFESQFDDAGKAMGVPWDQFVIPVAPSYAAFVDLLQPNKK